MSIHIKDKVVLVTGGTKGIGLGITKLFLQNDAKVVASYKNDSESAVTAEKSLAEYKDRLFIMRAEKPLLFRWRMKGTPTFKLVFSAPVYNS